MHDARQTVAARLHCADATELTQTESETLREAPNPRAGRSRARRLCHSNGPLPSHAAMPSTPTPPEWPLAHVLVVDDRAGMRNFLEKTLASRCGGCTPPTPRRRQLIRHHRFDLLVLDITLPGKSGIAWLRELREQGYMAR